MRSFEVPAVGGCMLVEDTDEHRALFGPAGEAVEYFSTVRGMVESARMLLTDPGRRQRLAETAQGLVTGRACTYRDRLGVMLGLA
jgi:hypothetical protein